jgi:hypothetical protein
MPPDTELEKWKKLAVVVAATVICYINLGMGSIISPYYDKLEYHNSSLTGYGWLQELLHGHPDRIHTELATRNHVFWALCLQLRLLGAEDSKFIALEESLAIFLYVCRTGLSVHHVGERFQHTGTTISK